ncbi:hypothetical protein KAI04_00850 [Candidatus Pacearchaeota archaeon]|nr:hypothetical protein [Candidatus Pacearchaeota archaeon]
MANNYDVGRTENKYVANLKEKRERAIARWDGIEYIQTTTELGFDLDEVPGLVTRGHAQMASLGEVVRTNTGNLETNVLEDSQESGKEESKFSLILKSCDFHFLYENMDNQNLKGPLGELKRAGYKGPDGKGMQDYFHMDVAQKWNYINEIRKDLNCS